MAVNYVTVKTSFKKSDKINAKFIKIVKNSCIDGHKMSRLISDQCSITESDVVAVLQAYETNLKMMFANGNSVEMFNLGTLKPCFKADFDNKGNVIKSSLRLSKIRLISGSEYINEAKGYHYRYCGEVDYNKSDIEERASKIIDYLLSEDSFITCRKCCAINNCSTTTALKDLKVLTKEGIILESEIGKTFIYSINPDYKNIDDIENDYDDFLTKNSIVSEDYTPFIVSDLETENSDTAPQKANKQPVAKSKISADDVNTSAEKDITLSQNITDDYEDGKSSAYDFKKLKKILQEYRKESKSIVKEDDEAVKMFYELIGGKFDKNISNYSDFNETTNKDESSVLISASEKVMQKLASDMGINDIYDARVIKKLNPKVFPMFMLEREKMKREKDLGPEK